MPHTKNKQAPTPKRKSDFDRAMDQVTATTGDTTSMAMLGALNIRHSQGKAMYLGTADPVTVKQRRKKVKRARRTRIAAMRRK